jgi:hypothetical protein
MEITSAAAPQVRWHSRANSINQVEFGPWMKAIARHNLLENGSYYPPPPVNGLTFNVNGVHTTIAHGNWEFAPATNGLTGVLYLGTATAVTEGARGGRRQLSVPQRALVLLTILELVDITNAPDGAVEEVQALLLEHLTSKEQSTFKASVQRLTATRKVVGIGGIGLAEDKDLVVLSEGKWFKAGGEEVTVAPKLHAKFAV